MSLPDLNRSLIRVVTVPVAVGVNCKMYKFASASALATILTAGYFNFARGYLAVGDVIDIVSKHAAADEDVTRVKVTAVPSSGSVTVAQADALAGGGGPRAVTATADGLTTGLLTEADGLVEVTSGNAAHYVTLPPIANVPLNTVIRLQVGANGHKLVTPATSNTKINNGDSDGTATTAIPANSITVVTKQAADNWIAECYVAAGTRTIPTPA